MSLLSKDTYKQTQSNILSLQETILNSSRDIPAISSLDDSKRDEIKNNKDTIPHIDTTSNHTNTIKIDSSLFWQAHNAKYLKDKVPCVVLQLDYNFGSTDPLYHGEIVPVHNSDSNSGNRNEAVNLFAPVYDTPFMPNLNSQFINSLVQVTFTSEQIIHFLQEGNNNNINNNNNVKRLKNNEIWGVDIYTLDSDPLLILKHCGLFDENDIGTSRQRTPGNVDNLDNVHGLNDTKMNWTIPNYDVSVQFIILDTLQVYQGFNRHGLISRTWDTDHHGLSCGVWQVEVSWRSFTQTTQ